MSGTLRQGEDWQPEVCWSTYFTGRYEPWHDDRQECAYRSYTK
jgi:hypothetical protein